MTPLPIPRCSTRSCAVQQKRAQEYHHVNDKLAHFGPQSLFRVATPGTGLCRADGPRRSLACRYRDPPFANWRSCRGCSHAWPVLAADPRSEPREIRTAEGSLTGASATPNSKMGAAAPIVISGLGRPRNIRVDHPSITSRRSSTMPQPRCGASTIGSCRRSNPDNTARPPGASDRARSRASSANGRARIFDKIRS
jgi:hypothetical protein